MHIQQLSRQTWFQVLLAIVAAVIVSFAMFARSPLLARVYTVQQKEPPWRILTVEEVDSGATIPADTNVVFHVPEDIWPISRSVLFGRSGNAVRYWGYCYPDNYDPKTSPVTYGFPGKLFLSEAEQAWREQRIQNKQPIFSIFNPPTKPDVARRPQPGRISNQLDVFQPGATCYVMTSKPLPIGTDRDGDGLNAREEYIVQTNPQSPDSDGDGLTDGVEVLKAHTKPTIRDTDGDGLIDGVEDKNRNGIIDTGETSPINPDSDGDGLCDGYCRVDKGGRICSEYTSTKSCQNLERVRWTGEDKNLDGIVDNGETDPLKWASGNDGVSDLQQYYNCLLQQRNDC
ncbi:MAG: thrombospondin type 3 repeat family [Candidatus Peribacteria bacterium]|nr:thrombospondin type 3 repeat family [Candidatus Peribacteria bacterium]